MRSYQVHGARLLLSAAIVGFAAQARAADPTTQDCLSANEASISLRREFKLRAARAELLVCAAANCPADVRRECAQRVDEVNAAMPTLVFEAKDASGADVSAVRVTMDGQPLAERLEGTAISIDPGSHSFRFEGTGFAPVEKTLIIREGEKDRREPITLSAAQAPLAPAPSTNAAAPALAGSASPTSSDNAPESKPNSLATAGLVVGGTGVVALVVGSVFGLKAKSEYSKSNDDGHCDASGCDPSGLQSRNDAFSAARVSTAFFVAGGALVAGGITLYFVAKSRPPDSAASLRVSPLMANRGAGVFIHGGF